MYVLLSVIVRKMKIEKFEEISYSDDFAIANHNGVGQ